MRKLTLLALHREVTAASAKVVGAVCFLIRGWGWRGGRRWNWSYRFRLSGLWNGGDDSSTIIFPMTITGEYVVIIPFCISEEK